MAQVRGCELLEPIDCFNARVAKYKYEWSPRFSGKNKTHTLITAEDNQFNVAWNIEYRSNCNSSCCDQNPQSYGKRDNEDHWDYIILATNHRNGRNAEVHARATLTTGYPIIVFNNKFKVPGEYKSFSFRERGVQNLPRNIQLVLEIISKLPDSEPYRRTR